MSMDKMEIIYRIKKIETMMYDYTTLDTDIQLMCCMEEVLKILKILAEEGD